MSTSNGKPQPGTLIDDLRALAVVLPPNFRARGAETADLLGALIARAELGHGLVDAAKKGPQPMVDFIHDAIAADAEARGVDAPVKGNPVENVHPSLTPAPPGGVTRQELEQFKQDLLGSIQAMLHADKTPAGPAAASEGNQGEDAGGDKPPESPASDPAPDDQADLGL